MHKILSSFYTAATFKELVSNIDSALSTVSGKKYERRGWIYSAANTQKKFHGPHVWWAKKNAIHRP